MKRLIPMLLILSAIALIAAKPATQPKTRPAKPKQPPLEVFSGAPRQEMGKAIKHAKSE